MLFSILQNWNRHCYFHNAKLNRKDFLQSDNFIQQNQIDTRFCIFLMFDLQFCFNAGASEIGHYHRPRTTTWNACLDMENHLNHPVVVIIEDMDRCNGAYKKLRRECRAWGCQFEVVHQWPDLIKPRGDFPDRWPGFLMCSNCYLLLPLTYKCYSLNINMPNANFFK